MSATKFVMIGGHRFNVAHIAEYHPSDVKANGGDATIAVFIGGEPNEPYYVPYETPAERDEALARLDAACLGNAQAAGGTVTVSELAHECCYESQDNCAEILRQHVGQTIVEG